jgi:hypothetical protein
MILTHNIESTPDANRRSAMNKRRSFIKSAMGLGAAGTMGAMAAGAATGDRTAVPGGIRLGNLYFSSGLTGVRPEARKDFAQQN